jgi:hypothetical protein
MAVIVDDCHRLGTLSPQLTTNYYNRKTALDRNREDAELKSPPRSKQTPCVSPHPLPSIFFFHFFFSAEWVLADSDVSMAPPRRSLRHLDPTPGQPTPTDNPTTAPTAATRRRQAPQPQADETDAGRLANETNKEATHDTKANEQNDDPEKEGDTKQAETDEDEESNNDDQHAEQDNQQDNAEANDQRDRNPDPNLDTGLATRQRATTTATRPQAALTNLSTNIAMRQHATPTSVKGTIPGKGNANTKTTGVLSL